MATPETTTQPVSAPSPAGASVSPAAPAPPQQPADDWQSRYTERDKEYADLKSKYDRYAALGEPEQIGQVYNTLRQIQADFQAGKLTYAQAQEAKRELQQDKDPFDGWEDLQPREQAQRMRDMLRTETTGLTKAEMDAFRKEMRDYQVNLGTQQQLLFRIIQLKTENPDLDIDALLKQSTEASTYGPQQILELQAKAMRSPKEQEKAIARAVEEAKAKWQQEQDAKKVPMSTRQAPRLTRLRDKASPIERREERLSNLFKRSEELNTRKVS